MVTFKPEEARSYQSKFRFVVEKGNSYDILLSGEGTYDEDYLP